MRIRLKLLSILLLTMLLFQLFTVTGLTANEVFARTYEKINGFNNSCSFTGKIPPQTKPCNENGYKFNSKLHEDKGLLVYGDYNSVGSINSFSKGTQISTGNTNPNDGYYTRNGGKGEYRYHGFSVDGELYTNINYINDKTTSTKIADKHWIYRPWNELPSSYDRKPSSPGSVYEQDENILGNRFNNVKEVISSNIGLSSITAGVRYADRYRTITDPTMQDVRNYMQVADYPTPFSTGTGIMYHYSWTSEKIWYESFTLEPLKNDQKDSPPAACEITVYNSQPIKAIDENKIKVKLKVVGSLLDEGLNEDLFYTGKDIYFWNIDFANQDLKSFNETDIANNRNKGSHIFELEIDSNKLQPTADDKIYEYKVVSSVHAVYINDRPDAPSRTPPVQCDTTIKFKSEFGNQTFNSDFLVTPEVHFIFKSSFEQSMVGYADLSVGKEIDYYDFTIKNEEDGTTETKRINPANPETLNEDEVEKFLYDFIASKFTSETTTTQIFKSFVITQVVTDKDITANNTSTAIKRMVVVQGIRGEDIIGGCTPDVPDKNPPIPQYVTLNTSYPLHWWDQVPMPVSDADPDFIPAAKACTEAPGYGEFSKKVFVDGVEVNAAQFFNGEFVFGEGNTGIVPVEVQATAPDGTVSHLLQHVVVHPAKPWTVFKLEGNYKENRTMIATDVSSEHNDQWAEQQAPLEITEFSYVNPNDENLVYRAGYGEDNKSQKMFMYKGIGEYQLSLSAKRTIHYGNNKSMTFYSDPYVVEYPIIADHNPAIIVHQYGNQTSRLDQLAFYYDNQSVDGDFVNETKLTVYYDSKHDNTFDTKVFETTDLITELPTFDKLGQYKIVAFAKEDTIEPRLMEFITEDDYRTQITETYFFVDNYAPATDLYLDTPTEMPKLDVYFLLDANLKQASTDYIRNQQVMLTNLFTQSSMLANLSVWDQKTYKYYVESSTSKNYGGSTPPETITYTDDNGYSGTMERIKISNNPYPYDAGEEVTVTDTKTGTDTCVNVVTVRYSSTGHIDGSSGTSECPSSMPKTDGSYSGTLGRTGQSPSGSCGQMGPPGGSCSVTWTAYYSGTLSWTRQEWKENWITLNNYTGFYEGTLSKDVRQEYDPSFYSETKYKYVVYVSDGTIKDIADVRNIMNKQDTKLILLGGNAIRSQITHDHHLLNNKPIENMVADVIELIAQNNPAIPRVYKLLNEQFYLNKASFDYEGDALPASLEQLQIVQDPKHFDNSLGFARYNGKNLISEKNAANWTSYNPLMSFNKTGKYTFIRRIKDMPSTDPRLADYSYYSNEAVIEVLVHRKPIAEMMLDFDYQIASNTYKTVWVDQSYDLDHNITRAATDRGIQDHSTKFTHIESGEVFTKIPDELIPGNYKLEYIVQDIEGVWSDPFVRTYELPSVVPVQFRSNLRTEYSGFSLNSVPASENLVAHDLWTRYPYSVNLNFSMPSYLSRNVNYYTGTKTNNDIRWSNEVFTIPETTPDGRYTFTITANGSAAGSRASNTYNVRVVTPINLSGAIHAEKSNNVSSFVVGQDYTLTARTTKYPYTTTVTLYKGTAYQRNLTLTSETASSVGYGQKNWSVDYRVPSNVPNGTYTVEWTSRTRNGNVETVSQTIELTRNRPPVAGFTYLPSVLYEGDILKIAHDVSDPDSDRLSVYYELIEPNGRRTVFPRAGDSYQLDSNRYRSPAFEFNTMQPGSYKITQWVDDGTAPPVQLTRTIIVSPLSIAGQVTHTELWERYRQEYNAKLPANSDKRWESHQFYSGERFMLAADTTLTNSESADKTYAVEVVATLSTTGTSVNLTYDGNKRWAGSMWQESFAELTKGKHTFVFVVRYSNGVSKRHEVDIEIIGKAAHIANVQRWK